MATRSSSQHSRQPVSGQAGQVVGKLPSGLTWPAVLVRRRPARRFLTRWSLTSWRLTAWRLDL